jgi:hypothetical protein
LNQNTRARSICSVRSIDCPNDPKKSGNNLQPDPAR